MKKVKNVKKVKMEWNYQWFRYFLLKSAVWLVRDETNDTNDGKDDESILFDSALEVVNDEFIKQQQFILDNVDQNKKRIQKCFHNWQHLELIN